MSDLVLIGVVGPCAAGKSTLIESLHGAGLSARHIAQEHSFVPDMWRRITRPVLLIYLDVSFPISLSRKPMDWSAADFADQVERLQHAREHADLYIDTSSLTPGEVLARVLEFLNQAAPAARDSS